MLSIKWEFSHQFPGPFDYRAGRDGVDNTFDVFCLTTDQWIISTHYWEERLQAELVARIVSNALNFVALDLDRDTIPSHLLRDLAQFQEEFLGPYVARREHCGYYGPLIEIACESTDACVLFAPAGPSVRMICRHVARCLNQLVNSMRQDDHVCPC